MLLVGLVIVAFVVRLGFFLDDPNPIESAGLVADPAPTSPAGLSPHLARRRALRAATADSPLAAVPTPACAGEHSWRSGPNPRSGAELGYSLNQLDEANRRAVALAEEIREAEEVEGTPIVINGVVGPHGDGYDSDVLMPADEAERYS